MDRTETPAGRTSARGWPYIVTGALFAAICAWISYNDGLFVTSLAGNQGRIVYAYPLLPDVLIVLSLLALAQAARTGVPRSKWAMAGLLLGIALTLAMNTGAGIAHTVLDAVMDGMVPVVFFIAVEIVLWHVRHREASQVTGKEIAVPGAVPADVLAAARASMAATSAAGNPLSQNQLEKRFGLKRADAREVWAEFASSNPPAGPAPGASSPGPAGADRGQGGDSAVPRRAEHGSRPEPPPAGAAPPVAAPAGAPALNGQAAGG